MGMLASTAVGAGLSGPAGKLEIDFRVCLCWTLWFADANIML